MPTRNLLWPRHTPGIPTKQWARTLRNWVAAPTTIPQQPPCSDGTSCISQASLFSSHCQVQRWHVNGVTKNTASLGNLSPSRRSRRRKRSSLDAQSTPSTQLYEAVLSDGHMKWKRPDFCAGFFVVLCEFLTEKGVCVCWWRRPNK